MTRSIGYTPEMLAWLERHQAGITRQQLADDFNAKFDMTVGYGSIKNLCARKKWISGISGRIEKGSTPWNKGKTGYMGANKTSFKKGQKVHNHKPVGSERICSKDGYILVKVAEPKKWRGKHIVVWESVNGKILQGHCIRFLDNDRTNCDIDNLICVNRAVHAVVNKRNPANSDNPDVNHAIILTEQINHTVKNIDRYRSTL